MVLPPSRLPRRVSGARAAVALSRIDSAIQIHSFDDSAALAKSLARAVGASSWRITLHRFPDGESLPRVHLPVARRAVVVRCLRDCGAALFETLLAADALRRAGARHLTLVTPYLPYMRQDRVFRSGEPLSQRVFAALLASAFDQVLTVEAHLHRIRRLSEVVPGRSLSAAPILAQWIRRHARDRFIVGPDAESAPWLRPIARQAGVECVVGQKQRLGDRSVRITLPVLPAARGAVLIDDIASSGATLAAAARLLRQRGVRQVDAVVVHAIFAKGALQRIRRAGVARVLSCDTIPHPTNAIACAPLIAEALHKVQP